MKFNDVKLLLPASGYMKTTQVNGRTVIDEMRDASYERNHQTFAGDDRPELHEDLQGRFFTCVEKESTNLFLNSDSLSTQGVEVTADAHTVSFEGAGTIAFSGDYTGSLEGVEGERVEVTFTPSAGTLTCTVSGDVLKAQIEQSQYSTLYIPTQGTPVTRLAPSPVIENALPETGTVAMVNSVVKTIISQIVGNDAPAGTGRVEYVYTSTQIVLTIFGGNGGNISASIPFAWSLNERKDIASVITFNSSTLKLYVLVGESIYSVSSAHEINSTADKTLALGHRPNGTRYSSVRIEKTLEKYPDFYLINATDEEIKAFFEQLVKGTSMEMKAEDMEIVA